MQLGERKAAGTRSNFHCDKSNGDCELSVNVCNQRFVIVLKGKKDHLFSMRIVGQLILISMQTCSFSGKNIFRVKTNGPQIKQGIPWIIQEEKDQIIQVPSRSDMFFSLSPQKANEHQNSFPSSSFVLIKSEIRKKRVSMRHRRQASFSKRLWNSYFFPPSSHGEEKEKRNISVRINGARIRTW